MFTSDAQLLVQPLQTGNARTDLHREMLRGFAANRRAGGSKWDFVNAELCDIQQFVAFTNDRYAWEWGVDDVEGWGAHLADRVALSTARGKMGALRRFFDFLTDPARTWLDRCRTEFQIELRQLCVRGNTFRHAWVYEGDPERRAYSPAEEAQLFRGLHTRLDRALRSRRKGALTAARDLTSTVLYRCWGVRADEGARVILPDFRNSWIPELRDRYGPYSMLHVRYGKAKRHGPKRPRWVHTLPELGWGVDVLRWYITDVRPLYNPKRGHELALFLTDAGRTMTGNYASSRFCMLRAALALPEELTLHCLRHTYITHLLLDDYPELFVREQVGHEDSASTAIYTDIPNDFSRRILLQHCQRMSAYA